MQILTTPAVQRRAYPSTWDRRFARTGHYALMAVGAALVAGAAMVAQAQPADGAGATPAPVVQAAPAVTAASPAAAPMHHGHGMAPTLTIRDIYDRLQGQGFRDFREIEWDDGRYKVKASSADGRRVKLQLDGRDGTVLSTRYHR